MPKSKLNLDSLESYIKSLSTIILDKYYAEHQVISGQQIVNLTPIKQVNFFILKVLFSQWQEETKKFKSPFFDYNNDGVKNSLKLLVNTLSKNISIERDDFEPLLEIAIKETLILIYEPNKFFDSEIKGLSGSNYSASFKALSRYIKLRKEAFTQISDELEEGNTENHSVELASIIHTACGKKLDDVSSSINLFNQILALDILDEFEQDEPIQYEPEQEEPIAELEEEVIITSPSEIEEKSIEEEIPEDSDDVTDSSLDNEFEPLKVSEEIVEDTESPSNINESFASESNIINEQFEEELKPARTIVEQHQEQSVSELHSSINVNQRYMFLNDLFEGNVEAYNKAIENIEGFESFDNSVEYLMQNYSRKYQWDMTSDEVKELLKVIFKRFR